MFYVGNDKSQEEALAVLGGEPYGKSGGTLPLFNKKFSAPAHYPADSRMVCRSGGNTPKEKNRLPKRRQRCENIIL